MSCIRRVLDWWFRPTGAVTLLLGLALGVASVACSTPQPSEVPTATPTPEASVPADDAATATPVPATRTPTATSVPVTVETSVVSTGETATVITVVDGDTIDVEIDGQEFRVRYIGIDAPERGEPFYREARRANRRLVADTQVRLVKDVSETDSDGRLLRYVYLMDGTFVNAELVRRGYAGVVPVPPDVGRVEELRVLEAEARDAGRGLWGETAMASESTPTSPPAEAPEPSSTPSAATASPTLPVPPAPSSTATAPPTSAVVAPSGPNLLVNGNFTDGFAGWSMQHGYWRIHDITGSRCDANNPDWPDYMAEMDRDRCTGCNTWPVGREDRLWQIVQVPAHDTVVFQITEAHHMRSGVAEVTIYGADDGENWTPVFHRPEPDAAYGVGHFCETPPTFTYSFDGGYNFYRLEVYGHLVEENDGWILGPLHLSVE